MSDPSLAPIAEPPSNASERRRAYREARTAIDLLRQRWPAAFPQPPHPVRPLISGAVSQIANTLGWSHAYARAVLRAWKLSPAYCHAVLVHPVRFDLDGSPTDQPIDEEARTHARTRLAALANKRQRVEARPDEQAAAPPSPVPLAKPQPAAQRQQSAAPKPRQAQPPKQPGPAPTPKLRPPRQQSSPPAAKAQPAQQRPSPPPTSKLQAPQSAPTWRSGDKVRWNGYTGTFLREMVGGDVEVLIGPRTYKVPKAELRPA
jgi:sRNA-binding protein